MLCACAASAQQAWTLQDCLDYALKHNIQVQKNRISEERGEVSLWQDKGALFPSLSFNTTHSVGYRPFTEVISVVQGDQVTSTRSNVTYQGSYGLNANVTLWNGGINYKNIKEQELQNRITALATEQSELTIQEQIAQLYVQIMYTKEAKKVNEQLLKTAQSQYDRGVEMMKQGQMARADVVQLEAQLSSAQYSVVNSETQLANYKRQLKALLELDLNTAFDVAGNTPTDEQVLALVPSAQEAYAKALEVRPEIKSAELNIEAADMQLNIAKRGFLPTIGASASLGSTHSTGSKNGWGEQMKTNLNMSAGLNFSVPIFDNRRNQSNLQHHRAVLAQCQQRSAELHRSQSTRQESGSKLRVAERAVPERTEEHGGRPARPRQRHQRRAGHVAKQVHGPAQHTALKVLHRRED